MRFEKPSEWSVWGFLETVSIGSGQVSPTEQPYVNYPHIGPENVDSQTGRITDVKIAGELGLISGKYVFDKNSIVYSKIRPNLNKVCQPDFEGICSADMYPIWPREDRVIKEYLYYFMRSEAFLRQAVPKSMRTGLPKINRRGLSQIKILLPSLPEQRRIAEILSAWDAAIDLVEQRKKGLMQRLLTSRARFPEFAGEWREVKLGKVFDERKERGYDDLPLLSVTADEGIIYRDELDRRDTSSSDKSKYLRVCEGDVAYNTMRMWQGRAGVSEYEGIVSPAYTVCEPEPEVEVDFMGFLFQLPAIIYKFRRYSQGMVSDTWTLRYDNFAVIKVHIPELAEQKKIASVLQTCDQEIELLTRKRDALQRQKKGLMQRLLTGKVRV